MEIGGYLGLDFFKGHEYYSDLIAVNSGRNALLYIIRARKISKLYIPYYLCDSVSAMCDRNGCKYDYYHINTDFFPVFDKKLGESEYLYIVNYFGQMDNEKMCELKNKFDRIIVDNVQAFFQHPVPGVDTVYSCRKFFGVSDGGYVSTNADYTGNMPEDQSKDRMVHVLGRFETGHANSYYAAFKDNEAHLDYEELKLMSPLTHNILKAIDYEYIKHIRTQNFSLYHNALKSFNTLKLNIAEGAYAYPFYCENGMKIKQKLAGMNIYIPTLWPNVLNISCDLEKKYAENILPLPVDQRYSADEVTTVIEAINGSI